MRRGVEQRPIPARRGIVERKRSDYNTAAYRAWKRHVVVSEAMTIIDCITRGRRPRPVSSSISAARRDEPKEADEERSTVGRRIRPGCVPRVASTSWNSRG